MLPTLETALAGLLIAETAFDFFLADGQAIEDKYADSPDLRLTDEDYRIVQELSCIAPEDVTAFRYQLRQQLSLLESVMPTDRVRLAKKARRALQARLDKIDAE